MNKAPLPKEPGPVLRLTVQFRDGTWSVLTKTLVDHMTVFASQPTPAGATRMTGLWFEVLDRKGTLLYRGALAEPTPGIEVHRRDGSMTRADAKLSLWSTDLLVPVLRKGTRLRLYHVPSAGDRVVVNTKDGETGLVLDLDVDDLVAEG